MCCGSVYVAKFNEKVSNEKAQRSRAGTLKSLAQDVGKDGEGSALIEQRRSDAPLMPNTQVLGKPNAIRSSISEA